MGAEIEKIEVKFISKSVKKKSQVPKHPKFPITKGDTFLGNWVQVRLHSDVTGFAWRLFTEDHTTKKEAFKPSKNISVLV